MFSLYNKYYLVGRRFRSFSISGKVDPDHLHNRPILYMMNHSSWWDGLLLYMATQKLSSYEHYVMMEERQLQKYAFFRKVGAYSINRDSSGDIRQSLRYTAELLEAGHRAWIFPQGEIKHLESRPITFKPGIGLLLRQCPKAAVVPVSLYHSLYQHSKPDVTMCFGSPITLPWSEMSTRSITSSLQQLLSDQVDAHRGEIIASESGIPEGYQGLMKWGRSTNEWLDGFKRKRSEIH
ncbi:lysophospholipid acyltransferase family protein [Paenibacillus pini]